MQYDWRHPKFNHAEERNGGSVGGYQKGAITVMWYYLW